MGGKVRLRGFFKYGRSMVTITLDCLRFVQNRSNLTLTADFIDGECHYQERIISFTTILDHMDNTIGKKVKEVLKECRLRNVSTIRIDYAPSNDIVVIYLEHKI